MNINGGTMKSSKLMFWALSVVAIVLFLGHSPLYAGGKKRTHADYRKKIILFNENTDWNDVKLYAAEWEKHGVILSMEIPIINGLAVGVPDHITDAELAADNRVSSIETNLELSANETIQNQITSFIKPLNRLPMVDEDANRYEAPWSVLKLFDQPYDNRYFSGWLAEDDIPDSVVFALKRLKKAKTPIVLFDTGVDARHKYTKKIVETGIDVVAFAENDEKIQLNGETPYDDNGHGSHVAGILGEILDKKHQWGQKSDIELNSVKVLGSDGMGYLSNIIYGLQWAIDNGEPSHTFVLVDGNGKIVWIKEAYERAVATTGTMHAVGKGDTGKAFSPTNVQQRAHVNIGSRQEVRPVQVGSTIVMIDQFGRRMHEFAYSFEINGYRAPELSIMSDHIIRKGVTDMAYAQDPESIIWMITNDGQLASCTYEKDQQIVGMARHLIANSAMGGAETPAAEWATVRSLTVISTDTQNEVWLLVQRYIDGAMTQYVEYFGQPLEQEDEGDDLKTDTTYLDSALMYSGSSTTALAGMDHLEGETVGVFGNGVDLGDAVVTGGVVNIPGGVSVTTATVGLRFTSYAKTLEPPTIGNRDGSHMGRTARVEEIVVNFMETGGLEVSTDGTNWESINDRNMDEVLESEYSLQTGKHRLSWTDDVWDDDKAVWVRSDKAYPATIRAMVIGIEGEP